ncbi:phage tape measure protein [Limosilactobacillus ingluviei DSM 15946]|uniref:Phage tape measure protein n=2 Tax=Limosilactobacillus ingluviei TaxID=148604 RepID=A0A0R1ULU9_9LACO|nr:phage tape measure protein [Limosilactobacillus ingluviei DSM 15946]
MAESMSIEAVLSAVDRNFTKTMEEAVNSLSDVISRTNSTARSSGAAMGSIKNLAGAMGLLAVGAKAFGMVKDSVGAAINRIDTLNNANRTFSNMDFSAKQTASAMTGLKKSINGLPTSLDGAVKGVQMIAASTGNLGKSQKVFSALNDGIIGFGGSTADVDNAVVQLSQAFANGKIDAQTWNSMMQSNMGPALNAIAKKMGVTTAELKDGLSSGKISVKDFQDALIDLDKNGGGGLKSLHKIALDSTAGIGTSIQNMKTAITRGTAEAIKAFDQFVKSVTGSSIAEIIANFGTMMENGLKSIGPALQSVAPAFKVLADLIKGAFSNDIFKGAAVGVLGFIGAFAGIQKVTPMLSALKRSLTVLKVASSVAKDMNLLKFALSNMSAESKLAAGAMKILNWVMSLNPWVVAAAAIVAVVGALVFFFAKTKTGQKLWKGFVSWLSGAWQNLVGIASSVWGAIGNAINAVVDFIKPIWQSLVTFFSGIWTSIMAVAAPIWQGLVSVVQAVVNLIVTIWQGLVTILAPVIAGVVAVVGSVLITIVGVFTTVWNMLIPIIQIVWQLVIAVITTAISMIGTVISTGISVIVTIWTTIWNILVTVVSTVWSVIGTVVTAGLRVIVDIVTAITDILQGNWSGAWNAIQNIVSTVLGAIGSIVSTILSGIVSVFSSIMNGLKGVVSSVWNGIKGLFSAGVNYIKSVVKIDLGAAGRAIMNSFLKGLKSVWESVKNFISGIGKWIKDHKGPISYDRKLLIPAGQAIMGGLNAGLINGFSEVQSNVSDMAGHISDLVSSTQADYLAGFSRFNGALATNFAGSLAVKDSALQVENNRLLRQIAAKDTTMVLDDGTLVGYTAAQYDQRLGQNTALKDRWSR